ncbi:hypothetical protein TKK_0006457 [Trichogramma kaykai]|uniref:Rab3 GTPase-activating protein catalytic subunit n=1 Tax=Trichogramma kaykai TaxID=54128 RepID=A0ABD2XEV2_9HYME
MNNVEIEDVYHHDFTTASEWEVFIARLEELIHEWKLPQRRIGPPLKHGDFINLPWDETSDKLNFADVEFRLKHFKLRLEEETTDNDCILVSEEQEDCWTQCQKDVLNASNDFVQLDQNHLEIARYYGIREFLVLVPSKKSSILDETRIKILLSSLTIAVSNARCELPAFVQAQESWQKFYLGVNVGKGSRMHLNMVHLKKIPPHCRHLTGLLSLFKQKINEGCGIQLDPVIVSVRLTYSLKDWTSSTWTQEPPDFDFLQGETLGVDELGKLPFGATFDPIKEFQLFVSWPEICENVVVDSESFSDLEPLSAPEWALQVEMVPGPACLLGEYLSNFLLLCSNPKSLTDILGDGAAYATDNDNQSIGSAFNILTESKIPSISTVVHRATSKSRKNVEGPITEDVLLPILYFVFPDAEGKSRAAYMSSFSSVDQGTSSSSSTSGGVGTSSTVSGGGSTTTAENVSGAGNNSSIDDQWRGIKTCAVDSLVWRLAVVAAHCAYNLGGQAAMAQLWHEFVQEVRFRWEKGIMLPG